MDIKQLNYFCTIVREGSVSAAARKLYMSQPPLSYQMKSLEQELGCVLFIRGNKNITLTMQGEILYKRAQVILQLLDSTVSEIKNGKHDDIIRIGVISSIVSNVANIISLYSQKNPEAVWEITEGNTYELSELLHQQRIDCAFIRQPFVKGAFQQIKLFDDKMVAVGKTIPSRVDLKYLSNQPLIIYRRWIEVVHQQFESQGLHFSYRFLGDDARTCLSLVHNNLGIALVPHSSVNDDKNLNVAEISDCNIGSAISLVYLPGAVYGYNQQEFIDFVKKSS
ncbi:MAG: LysR family transcriptional regulator [Erysipelotrichia bacterium]|nr:LysR family transcriptional regulator [Erysipelotrichia bacterium]